MREPFLVHVREMGRARGRWCEMFLVKRCKGELRRATPENSGGGLSTAVLVRRERAHARV